jgi:hypothetical protein
MREFVGRQESEKEHMVSAATAAGRKRRKK